MSSSVERDAVARILEALPVPRDGVLFVHSAFAGLSRTGHRAEAFCEALIDGLPGGTLLMPTMTWRTVTPGAPVFDARTTPSHTGMLTELFRTRFAEARSLHPTHSVAGRGPLAAPLLAGHHIGGTPCPAGSPYGLMRERPAAILLLGVGLESCTAIHHAEELIAPELYVRPPAEAERYTLIGLDGRAIEVETRRHRRLPRDFAKFEAPLRAAGQWFEGRIGETPWRLFALADLYRILFGALVEDTAATLT